MLRWAPSGLRLSALLGSLNAASEAEFPEILESVLRLVGKPPRGDELIRHALLAVGTRARSGALRSPPSCLTTLDASRVHQAIENLLRSDLPDEAIAGSELVALLPAGVLAPQLVSLLAQSQTSVGGAAEAALARLTQGLIEARADGRAILAGPVGQALVDAGERFRVHRRAGVIELITRAIVSGVRLTASPGSADRPGCPPAWLLDHDHAALSALRRHIRAGVDDPRTHGAAWLLLKAPTMAGACADRLSAAAAADLEALGRRAYLAANPVRACQLHRLVDDGGGVRASVLPTAEALENLSASARAGMTGWIAAIPAATRLRDAGLAGLLADPSPAVRHAAVRAATALPSRPACLLDYCFDAHPRVARSAALAVACQSERGMVQDPLRDRTLIALRRSTDKAVARIASEAAPPDALLNPDSAAARVELRRRVSMNGVVKMLTAAIAHHDSRRRCDALLLARRMGLVGEVRSCIEDLLDGTLTGRTGLDADLCERVLPAAASALGDLSDHASGELLQRCLDHGAPRLRANALDAIARRVRRGEALTEAVQVAAKAICQDEAHRPRASAARLLLATSPLDLPRSASVRDAGERTLVGMLDDPRPMHRVAGLWLAERAASRVAPLPEIVDAVAALAKAAEGGAERDRARRAAQRLVVEIRSGWMRRAKDMASFDPEEAAA